MKNEIKEQISDEIKINKEQNLNNEDMEIIKELLSNENFIKMVAMNGADNISQKIPLKEDIKANENSIVIMDKTNVYAMVTNSKLKTEPIAKYSISYLIEISRILGKDATLLILKENYPAVIEAKNDKTGTNDLMILAPRIGED